MKDGDKVVAGGRVDVYERDGCYQFYAKEITLEGAGALYERYLALEQMGGHGDVCRRVQATHRNLHTR